MRKLTSYTLFVGSELHGSHGDVRGGQHGLHQLGLCGVVEAEVVRAADR